MTVYVGGPKIPGIVKKIYLKYLYKFETLVPFEVLPLRLDAAIPAPLPMLETLSKIFKHCLKSSTEMQSRAASDPLAALDCIFVEYFRQCFQHWGRCWDCRNQSQGEYFEGD